MNKNIKLSFILLAVISAIVIAFRNLLSFFNGAAIGFIAMCVLIVLLLVILFSDKIAFNRCKDLFFIACGFTVLESIMYFAIDFNIGSFNSLNGFLVYQNILSILGFIYFAYIAFRFILEYKNIKLSFIEFILGNQKFNKKAKKAKEISNGTLEEKPNKVEVDLAKEPDIIEDADNSEE